jgi:hypothetical protein
MPSNQAPIENPVSNVLIKVEPGRLYPAFHFSFNKMTENNPGDPVRNLGYSLVYTASFREVESEEQKYVVARIPFSILRTEPAKNKPLRVDVIVQKSGECKCSWRPDNPLTPRLILGNDNPVDLGWLIFN